MTAVPAPCVTQKHSFAGHAVYSPQRQRHLEKEGIYTARARKVIPLLKAIN